MNLMRVPEFILKYWKKGSRPARKTVYAWIKKGIVPGQQLGTEWYVDEEAWLLQNNPLAKANPTAFSLVNRVMLHDKTA